MTFLKALNNEFVLNAENVFVIKDQPGGPVILTGDMNEFKVSVPLEPLIHSLEEEASMKFLVFSKDYTLWYIPISKISSASSKGKGETIITVGPYSLEVRMSVTQLLERLEEIEAFSSERDK